MELIQKTAIEFAVHRNGFCVGTVDYDQQAGGWVALTTNYECMGVAESAMLAAMMLPVNGEAR
jgi:hypothetical protein